jgi:hypothetical protein
MRMQTTSVMLQLPSTSYKLRSRCDVPSNFFVNGWTFETAVTALGVRAQKRYWRLRLRHGPAVTDICEDATARLWRGLAQRHHRLSHRAELLNLARNMSTTDPDRAAPWLLAAGYPERVAPIGLFASAPWIQLAASDDLLPFADAIAEFDRHFPTETPLRGTSRTRLGKTIAATAKHSKPS